jgi:hypothetical protein
MCPNINAPNKKICPPGGPQQKEATLCRFVKAYIDESGAHVFVSWVDTSLNQWFSVRDGNVKGTVRVKTKFLPIRDTFDEAQTDLNKYANSKGWRIYNA